jgi:hypothetical protein
MFIVLEVNNIIDFFNFTDFTHIKLEYNSSHNFLSHTS